LYDENNIIGFCAVLHQPHDKIKNLKRCSRIVILPDYQGIGLGTKFLNAIAEHYHNLHYEFSIVTSAKNMICSLKKSNKWRCSRYSTNKLSKSEKAQYCQSSIRRNCKTASFSYKGGG
jgi:GNAT superfamily N-acetyltransferase